MALGKCRLCGKLVNSSLDKICGDCKRRLDSVYKEAWDYIRDHPRENLNVEIVAERIGEDYRDVQELVDQGYLDSLIKKNDKEKLKEKLSDAVSKLKNSIDRKNESLKSARTYGQEVYGR